MSATGGFSTQTDHLTRSNLWSAELKDILIDDLQAMSYVNFIDDMFPDGDTLNIPSVGQAVADDYTEGEGVKYRAMDTGNFTFTITEYVSSGTWITRKQLQDSVYSSMLTSTFVPKQSRAIMERFEQDVLGLSGSQTASDLNTINGGNHRFVGGGANQVIELDDFARAKFALDVANVPAMGRVAIVDPSVEFTLNTLSNLTNVSNNPQFEGIVTSGFTTGMRFIRSIFGFDVYVSNYLADANETIDSKTTAAGKANMFFSAASDVVPFVGAMRQMPIVDSEFNKDEQREEYVTTARWGVKLYRPENLVCVLTDTDQVA